MELALFSELLSSTSLEHGKVNDEVLDADGYVVISRKDVGLL